MILISACLVGEKVRYDGQSKQLLDPILTEWLNKKLLLPLCPEVSGGLSVPRAPAEIQPSNGDINIITIDGSDVTDPFLKGAEVALTTCLKHNIKMAILTESSPSCGSQSIHNGLFDGGMISGQGVTTQLLQKNGIKVFSQHQLPQAKNYYAKLKKLA